MSVQRNYINRGALALIATAGALAVAAPAVHADHVRPNLGIDITSVDRATRTVEGIQHCTTPDRAGRPASFKVTSGITFDQFSPGVRTGIAVDANNVIQSTGEMPCDVPRGPGGPEGSEGPGGPGSFDGAGGPEGDMPAFQRGFLNRVWKFEVSIDDAEGGKLSTTIEKVLNLPKKFRSDDDELLDQDAVVLYNSQVRVYRDGKRVAQRALQDAEEARISGKLAPPQKWVTDADEQPVPTIRAKKIYLR